MDARAEPTRILHVVPGLGLGGAEAVLFRLVTGSSDDFEHEVACLGGRGAYSELLEARGIVVHHLDSRSGTMGEAIRLRQLLRRRSPSLLQCWMYRANMIGGLVGRAARVPVIWNIRSSSFKPFSLPARFFVRVSGYLAGRLPDYVINCSAQSRDLHETIGYGVAPGRVVPNGYDPALFHADEADRRSVRRELSIADDVFLVGSISRWNPFKDIPTLLIALREAAGRGVPLHCILAGVGLEPGNRDLSDAIVEAGCANLVTLLGPRQDVPRLVRGLDLHLLSSVSEGFPNVVAETMLSEVPNAVTDVGDAALIVGDTGWVGPSGDAPSLSGSIAAAYAEFQRPDQWQERRRSARARVVENFSLKRMVESYEEVWREFAQCSAAR